MNDSERCSGSRSTIGARTRANEGGVGRNGKPQSIFENKVIDRMNARRHGDLVLWSERGEQHRAGGGERGGVAMG